MDSAPPGGPAGRWKGSDHDSQDVGRSQQSTKSKARFDDLFADVDEGKAILLRRPDLISLYDPSMLLQSECASCRIKLSVAGFEFNISADQSSNGRVVESISQDDADGIVNNSAVFEGGQHVKTIFGVGDSLSYAFGIDCGMSKSVIGIGETHDSSIGSENEISLQFEDTPRENSEKVAEGGSCTIDPTVSFKTIPDESPIRLCQSIIILSESGCLNESTPDVELSDGARDATKSDPSIGIEFAQEDERLVVKSISKHSHFASPGCAVKEGHTVVGINEFIASVFTPEDAVFLVRSILASSPTQLSITTIATPKALTAWDKARKAAVLASGGALVATGTALLVTPVHPLGHLFQLGGGAVLATEFEGARTVMDRAKARFDTVSSDASGRTSMKDRWRRLRSRGNGEGLPAS